MKIIGVIPARYASTRFPAKALANIAGKPMVQRVYEQCLKADQLHDVVIATDHPAIMEAVQAFGGKAVMTKPEHPSGTDRIAEALQYLGDADAVVNIQGDEPFIAPLQINTVASMLLQPHVEIATLAKAIDHEEEVHSPHAVKVVVAKNGFALYFSRSAVPYSRGVQGNWHQQHTFYRHLGIYGFKAQTLKALAALPPSVLEQAEMLEQLRWLENGYRIAVGFTEALTPAIDTPEDLEKALLWARQAGVIA
jgi:3-deoxy-manno-octulosonate cytidylyltransferase (CMP-KDO synthetase)